MFTAVLSICTAVMAVKVLCKCCCTVLWCLSNPHSKPFIQYIGCARYVTWLVCRVGLCSTSACNMAVCISGLHFRVSWCYKQKLTITIYYGRVVRLPFFIVGIRNKRKATLAVHYCINWSLPVTSLPHRPTAELSTSGSRLPFVGCTYHGLRWHWIVQQHWS